MLSIILNGDCGIAVNIQITRVFPIIRETSTETLKIRLEFVKINRKLNNQSKNIEEVFSYFDELILKICRLRIGRS